MNRKKIVNFITAHSEFFKIVFALYNNLLPKNRLRVKGVKLTTGLSLLNGLKISCTGVNNEIIFRDFVKIKNCTITIFGSNNKIMIDSNSFLNQVEIYMEDNGNEFTVGKHTRFCGQAALSLIEGTAIRIGDNCLFSSGLYFCTGDSHSILNTDGKRINASKDILIKNHVWVGTRVTCLKGVVISDNSVVASTATLCKCYDRPNCIIGGVPGKVIKEKINWDISRVAPF